MRKLPEDTKVFSILLKHQPGDFGLCPDCKESIILYTGSIGTFYFEQSECACGTKQVMQAVKCMHCGVMDGINLIGEGLGDI